MMIMVTWTRVKSLLTREDHGNQGMRIQTSGSKGREEEDGDYEEGERRQAVKRVR